MSQPPEEPVLEPSEALSDEHLSVLDLDTIAWQSPSRRKHLLQLTLVVLIVVVALATTLWRETPSLIGPSLAPIRSLRPVEATLLSNVNFGTLLVNGRALAGHPPLTATLSAQGRTVITLMAPPFRPQSCRFTDLEPPVNDPVHCSLTYESLAASPSARASLQASPWTVGIYLDSDDLPSGQQSQVRSLLSQWLGTPQQTTVAPGDFYATSLSPDGCVMNTSQRATSRLGAQATLEVSQTPGCGLIHLSNCDEQGFCANALAVAQSLPLASHSWGLFFMEALRWQFTDASGTTLASVSFPTNVVGLILAYDPATGWQVSPGIVIAGDVQGSVCQAGVVALQFTLGSGNPPVPLHDRGVEGCELGATFNGVDGGRYVWRFGVLLAADAQAHRILPALPLASPAEIAAVGG
jgi:hypothetical protein